MKISKVGTTTQTIENNSKGRVQKAPDFSMAFDLANKEQKEGQLKQMLEEIDKLGKRLVSTRSVEDAKKYKKKIQEYLSYIIKNVYVLKKEAGPFNYGVHVRIEIINEKLDDLTKDLIDEQRSTLQLAEKIEEIRGLLVDAYQ